MEPESEEEQRLRSVALQNARSILSARQRAEGALIDAREALQKQTSELAASLEMLRATLEATTDGILVLDEAGAVSAINQRFITLWGMPQSAIAAGDRRSLLEAALPQICEPEAFLEVTEGIYAGNPPESFDVIRLVDGRIFERYSRIRRVAGRDAGRVWSYRDVTKRRQAEEEVLRQREWFEVTLASIGDAVITTDTSRHVTFLNPAAERLTGWTSAEASGQPVEQVFRIINERTREPVIDPIAQVLAEGVTIGLANDTTLLSRNGRETAIEDSASPIKDSQGKVAGAVMVFHDVTHRRRAQAALRASHGQFAAILDQSPIGVVLLDAELRFRHVNSKAQPVFHNVGVVEGRRFEEVMRVLWPEEVAAQLTRRFQDTLDTGAAYFEKRFSEVRQDTQAQEFYDFEVHRLEFPDGQRGVVCYFIDITAHVLAQQAVLHSEEELRALANSIPNLAWMAYADGSIFWYNQRWYEYTGTTFEGMQGWGWESVHHPDTLPRVLERWTSCVRSGARFEMEFPLRAANGEFRWFLTRVNPVRNEAGEVVRWFGTNTDVDEVRRAREAVQEETRVLDLLNSTGQAIAGELDLQTLVQTVTDAGTTLSGAKFGAFFYNVVDAQGESLLLFTLSGAPREAFEKFGLPRATAVFSPTFHGEGPVRSADITKDSRYGLMAPHFGMPKGHLPVRSYLAAPVIARSGEVIGGLFFGHPEVGVFTERSERLIVGVAAQAAVAIDNARLYAAAQREIGERRRAEEQLAAARDAAETASQAKDRFIAALSHELRTPLTPILAILSNLRQEGKVPADIAEDLETVRRNVELEARLIDDLLDLTRIAQGKLHLHYEQVSANRIIEDAIGTCLEDLRGKRLNLVRKLAEPPPVMEVDSARLTQILWNLLKNAIKFTPAGGTVTISSRLRPDANGAGVIIEVEDSGIGIEPEDLERVFQAFEQGGSQTTRQFGGLGLGLAISRAIARSHRGVLRASSPGKGRGSTFTLTLPCAASADGDRRADFRQADLFSSAASPAFPQAAKARPLRILLVEDHADTAAILQRVLRRAGHAVLAAGTVAEALALAAREMAGTEGTIDLLISDVGLPDGSGHDLMRTLAAKYPIKGIALSGYGMDGDLEKSAAAGFARHLIKPVDMGLLQNTIAGLMPAEE